MGGLDGRVAVVTGAASGIGRAVAEELGSRGAIVVMADYDAVAVQRAADALGSGTTVSAHTLDVSREAEVTRFVELVIEERQRIDILVNAAGVFRSGTVTETPTDVWHAVMAVNLTGTFLTSRAVLPHMVQRRSGAIINFSSSTGAQLVGPGAAAYVTSKGGVAMLTRSMAVDYAEHNVRVNAVCPGPTDTPMLRSALAGMDGGAQLLATIPAKRTGDAKEIARVVAFLASDDASFVTGALIAVDGGQTAGI